MRVYIASPLSDLNDAAALASELRAADGIDVVSTWHADARKRTDKVIDRDERKKICLTNWNDFYRSQVVIYLNGDNARGALVEVGAAIATGRPVLAVGNPLDQTLMLEEDVTSIRWLARENVLRTLLSVSAVASVFSPQRRPARWDDEG